MDGIPVTGPSANASVSRHTGCADFFRLVSMFLLVPTEELAQGVLDKSVAADMRTVFEDAGIDPSSAAIERLDGICDRGFTVESLHSALRCNFTELFTHPDDPLVSPYEMRFCDLRDKRDVPSALFLNEAALHAEQCYRKAGLVLSDARSREPGDHMAIELEFMAYLHAQLAAAVDKGDEAARKRWETALTEFLPHLNNWGIDFFTACERSGCGLVYPWIGCAGVAFLSAYFAEGAVR